MPQGTDLTLKILLTEFTKAVWPCQPWAVGSAHLGAVGNHGQVQSGPDPPVPTMPPSVDKDRSVQPNCAQNLSDAAV
jgi:hypothetical protein